MSDKTWIWTCACGASAPALTEGWRYIDDTAWCPKHAGLA